MNSENRMSVRRSLIPLALLAAMAAAASCADPSPMGVPAFERGGRWAGATKKGAGLVTCSQTYDSVTQVVGPAGGLSAGGVPLGPTGLIANAITALPMRLRSSSGTGLRTGGCERRDEITATMSASLSS